MQSCHRRIAPRLIVFWTVNNNEFELIISSPSSSQPATASCNRPGPRKTESGAQWPHQLYYLDAAAAQPHNTAVLDSKLPGSAASNPYPLEQAKTGFLTHLRTSFVHARAPAWIARFGQFQIPDTRGVQHLGRRGAEGDTSYFSQLHLNPYSNCNPHDCRLLVRYVCLSPYSLARGCP